MNHGTCSLLLVLSFPAIALGDSMLWMQWQGLGPDDREVFLAPGDTAVIEIYFRRDPDSLDLSHLAFRNEPALKLEQVSTTVLRGGWEDRSSDGVLGEASQIVDFRQFGGCGTAGCPPPAFDLYGTQSISLNGIGDGSSLEITFDLASIQVVAFTGFRYSYLASSSPLTDHAHYYHIGTGSPGYEDDDGFVDERDPLIVIPIPEPSTMLLLGLGMAALALRRRTQPS